MAKLAHMTVTVNPIKAKLKILSSAATNQTRSKRKYYCWSCGRNYTHGSKICSAKKAGHQKESYSNKLLGGIKKGCEWRLGVIINKVKISNPKISLINCIRTPPIFPSENMLSISDSGVNIYLAKQATTKMAPVIISNEMTARLQDGSTM